MFYICSVSFLYVHACEWLQLFERKHNICFCMHILNIITKTHEMPSEYDNFISTS